MTKAIVPTPRSIYTLPIVAALLWALPACYTPSQPTTHSERSERGKHDVVVVGSCLLEDGDACGGPSDESCWCDSECMSYGDCCGDFSDVCGSVDEPDTPDTECASAGGECIGGTVNCDTVMPGSEELLADCAGSGPGPQPQFTCCAAVDPVVECEAAGGTCIGGTVNCEWVSPGSEDLDLNCATGPGPHPQLTCCS